MTSKYQSQQKKSRWSEYGSAYTADFLERAKVLQASSRTTNLQQVATQLINITTFHSSYREAQALPELCDQLATVEGAVDEQHQAFELLAELFFLQNSKPLHKPLSHSLRKWSADHISMFAQAVVAKILQDTRRQEQQSTCDPGEQSALTEALLSILENSSLCKKLQSCALQMAEYLGKRMLSMSRTGLSDGNSGEALQAAAVSADEAQDTVSCLYLLLQHHSALLAAPSNAAGRAAIVQIGEAMLWTLQGTALLRDGLSSAAVTLWCAAKLPNVPEAELVRCLAQAFLLPSSGSSVTLMGGPGCTGEPGFIELHLRSLGTSLAEQLNKLPLLPKSCTLKGVLSVTPVPAFSIPLAFIPPKSSTGIVTVAEGRLGSCQTRQNVGEDQCCWDALIDGAVPTACSMLEAATDSYTKFHALGALTAALQLLSARMQCLVASRAVDGSVEGNASPDVDTASADPSAERPLPNIAVPFLGGDLRMQIMAGMQGNWEMPLAQSVKQINTAFQVFLDIIKYQMDNAALLRLPGQHVEEAKSYMQTAALQLLSQGRNRKGTYMPLKTIVSHFGASWLLDLQPDLLTNSLHAMEDDGACPSANAFMSELLGRLLAEYNADCMGDTSGYGRWQEAWITPLLTVLGTGSERLRMNISAYALPMLLKLDSSSLGPLLRQALHPLPDRLTADLDGQVAAVIAVLKAARQMGYLDSLEVCTLPGQEAIKIPKDILLRAIRHSSDALRGDVLHLVCTHPRITFMPGEQELKLAAEALSLGLRCSSSGLRSKWVSCMGKLIQRVVASMRVAIARRVPPPAEGGPLHCDPGITRLASFLQWLSATLQASIYPGAPFERKYFAMVLLDRLLELWTFEGDWSPSRGSKKDTKATGSGGPRGFATSIGGHQVFCPGFVGRQSIIAMLESAVDSWDKVRDTAVAALCRMPTPLPGFERHPEVARLVYWAATLFESPRVPEADSGARLVRMICHNYVLGLQVDVPWRALSDSSVEHLEHVGLDLSCLGFLQSLTECLQVHVDCAEADLEAASKSSFAHGTLLALRYVLAEVPWKKIVSPPVSRADVDYRPRFKALLKQLFSLLHRVAQVTLPVLALYQDAFLGAEDVVEERLEIDADFTDADGNSPVAQIITTACWLSLKEAGLVIGIIARHLPLADEGGGSLIDRQELDKAGDLFVDILSRMKHNGAVEKCIMGFVSLAERMLREKSPSIKQTPQGWVTKLLAAVCRPEQTLSDVNRRSAGLPFAFSAIFQAEPQGGHRALLQYGMTELMKVATDSAREQPYPQVHAFNIMRFVFEDRSLSTEVPSLVAQGVQATLTALSSPHWEVRNAAGLAYTSLVVRMLAFKNAEAGLAITSLEFFQRYPDLHPFLLQQLSDAAKQLGDSGNELHPSLFPILALLSRMRQAGWHIDSIPAKLDPAVFKPFVKTCTHARLLAIRQIAATALTRILGHGESQHELVTLLHSLPLSDGISNHNQVHGDLLQIRALLLAVPQKPVSILQDLVPQLSRALGLADYLQCPAIAAEAIEVGRTLLSLNLSQSLSPTETSGQSKLLACANRDSTAAFALQMSSACRCTLIGGLALASKKEELQTGQRQEVESLKRDAMRPVLLENAICGLLDAIAASQALQNASLQEQPKSHRDGDPCSSSDDHTCGLLPEDVQLLLGCRDTAVRLAGLKGMLKMLSEGLIDAPIWLSSMITEYSSHEVDSRASSLAHQLLLQLPGGTRDDNQGPLAPSMQSGSRMVAAAHRRGLEGLTQSVEGDLSRMQLEGAGIPCGGCQHPTAELRFQQSSKGVHQGWQEQQKLLLHARSPEAREDCLHSMGAIVDRLLRHPDDVSCTGVVAAFLGVLRKASHAAEVASTRLAAQLALHDSGLLGWLSLDCQKAVSNLQMEAWILVLQMTEDEDHQVRQGAARSAGRALAALGKDDCSYALAEYVQRQSFALLTQLYAGDMAYVQHLLDWIFRPEAGVGTRGAQQRLFSKEKDNEHEEPLLFAQYALQQLQIILSSPHLPSDIVACVAESVNGALQGLKDLCLRTDHLDTQLLGGHTFSAEHFSPLYCALLGISLAGNATASLPLDPEIVYSELREIARMLMQSYSLHPLVNAAMASASGCWQLQLDYKETPRTTGNAFLQCLPLLHSF